MIPLHHDFSFLTMADLGPGVIMEQNRVKRSFLKIKLRHDEDEIVKSIPTSMQVQKLKTAVGRWFRLNGDVSLKIRDGEVLSDSIQTVEYYLNENATVEVTE